MKPHFENKIKQTVIKEAQCLMDINVHMTLWDTDFVYFGYVSRSGTSGSDSSFDMF